MMMQVTVERAEAQTEARTEASSRPYRPYEPADLAKGEAELVFALLGDCQGSPLR